MVQNRLIPDPVQGRHLPRSVHKLIRPHCKTVCVGQIGVGAPSGPSQCRRNASSCPVWCSPRSATQARCALHLTMGPTRIPDMGLKVTQRSHSMQAPPPRHLRPLGHSGVVYRGPKASDTHIGPHAQVFLRPQPVAPPQHLSARSRSQRLTRPTDCGSLYSVPMPDWSDNRQSRSKGSVESKSPRRLAGPVSDLAFSSLRGNDNLHSVWSFRRASSGHSSHGLRSPGAYASRE